MQRDLALVHLFLAACLAAHRLAAAADDCGAALAGVPTAAGHRQHRSSSNQQRSSRAHFFLCGGMTALALTRAHNGAIAGSM
jgi:ribosomal protein L34E